MFCLDFCKIFDMIPHGVIWIWWVRWWVDEELVEWSHPEDRGLQFSVQMAIGGEWCPLGFVVGAVLLISVSIVQTVG